MTIRKTPLAIYLLVLAKPRHSRASLTLQVNQLVVLTLSLVLRLYMYMTSSYELNQGQTSAKSQAVVVSYEILTV